MTAGREPISGTKDWCTPPEYVAAVRRVLGTIHLDPCSNVHSVVGAEIEIALPVDGLAESWDAPTVYVNPPYGRDRERGTTIADWLARCTEARASGSEVLALVPVATNTRHWQNHVFTASGVCFLKVPRLKFALGGEPAGKGAPMACAVVYWGPAFDTFQAVFCDFGVVLSCPDPSETQPS